MKVRTIRKDLNAMRMTVIGTGYLGAVHAACMAELGHDVLGVDIDEAKVAALAAGRAPFYEPGLDALLADMVDSGRLRFSTSLRDAAEFADLHFVCVGTPQMPGSHAADVSYLDAVIVGLAPHLRGGSVVVGKSTVPVGTAARLQACMERLSTAEQPPALVWNPEFLREGFSLEDTRRPDRIVIGTHRGQGEAVLRGLYAPMFDAGTSYISTDWETAELVKVAANSFLATKVSFINAMSEVCEATGADVATLARAIGHDARIGSKFLRAGVGFGGGCLPKDIRAFAARANEIGTGQAVEFLREVDSINVRARTRVVNLAIDLLGGDARGRRVGILGATFKPDSDDVRDSPALYVGAALRKAGAEVRVHDPRGLDNARLYCPELDYAYEVEKAVENAQVVLHLTEWHEYRQLDPAALARATTCPVLLDARDSLDVDAWRAGGWQVRVLGRPRR